MHMFMKHLERVMHTTNPQTCDARLMAGHGLHMIPNPQQIYPSDLHLRFALILLCHDILHQLRLISVSDILILEKLRNVVLILFS